MKNQKLLQENKKLKKWSDLISLKKISSFYFKILKDNEARLKLFLGESGKLCRVGLNEALYTGGFTGM